MALQWTGLRTVFLSDLLQGCSLDTNTGMPGDTTKRTNTVTLTNKKEKTDRQALLAQWREPPTLRTYTHTPAYTKHTDRSPEIHTNKKNTSLLPLPIGCTGFMQGDKVPTHTDLLLVPSCTYKVSKDRSCIYRVKFALHVDVWGWWCWRCCRITNGQLYMHCTLNT